MTTDKEQINRLTDLLVEKKNKIKKKNKKIRYLQQELDYFKTILDLLEIRK